MFLVSALAKKQKNKTKKKQKNAEVIGTYVKKYFLNLKVGYSWKLCSRVSENIIWQKKKKNK